MSYVEIHPVNPESRKISEVVSILKKGGVIIYPTDSVYSFGCSIENKRAIERIAKIKGEKLNKSKFSIICKDLSQIGNYTKQYSRNTFKLLNKSLPGPYTFILEANNAIPKLFNSKRKEIGIRIPDNNICKAIVEALGVPMVTSSVIDKDDVLAYENDPQELFSSMGHSVDIFVDGGLGNIEPSTVIDCLDEDPVLVRQGIGAFYY